MKKLEQIKKVTLSHLRALHDVDEEDLEWVKALLLDEIRPNQVIRGLDISNGIMQSKIICAVRHWILNGDLMFKK
ncbi:MAG: hypothetical protein IPL32_19020 [Chloracidobacterium sp.]|nr:hypothetical protein [Chloracidobacterium sp.]